MPCCRCHYFVIFADAFIIAAFDTPFSIFDAIAFAMPMPRLPAIFAAFMMLSLMHFSADAAAIYADAADFALIIAIFAMPRWLIFAMPPFFAALLRRHCHC